jgi:hypothetical protein
LPLILTTALALVLPDLIFGGMRSTVPRYLIPCYIGIELSIVNLIYSQIIKKSNRILSKKSWQFFLVIILSIGVIYCSIINASSFWSIQGFNRQNIPIAEIINKSAKPLVITYFDNVIQLLNLISINHSLTNQNITIRLVDRLYLRKRDRVFSDIFILNPPQEWLDLIEKENKFKVKKIYQCDTSEDPNSEFYFRLLRFLP